MRVICAPKEYVQEKNDIRVFLAGGICGCEGWQDNVIDELKKYNLPNLVVFNPRRKHFPIDDAGAARVQIEWEFRNLEECDIFSMYFCGGSSDQPICMYELGRNLLLMQNRFGDWKKRLVISADEGYKRLQDVIIQCELAGANVQIGKSDLYHTHARLIAEAVNNLQNS
ncbi:MAG: nucleoside 2-deoxyribosyltransferase domain-containing protein [Alphaproteobacteria bacterium]|nr:nucleoside 2-deoxyribosyltransferase domain-containing protein [Alphaproteobacteria bacterium]